MALAVPLVSVAAAALVESKAAIPTVLATGHQAVCTVAAALEQQEATAMAAPVLQAQCELFGPVASVHSPQLALADLNF